MRVRCRPLLTALAWAAPMLAVAQTAAVPVPVPERIPEPERYVLRLEYREFRPTLTGEIQNGFGDDEGTLIDITSDLGIVDERTFEVRGAFQLRRGHKIRASFTRLNYDGRVDARRTFTFDDTRFERFDQVVTTLRGAYYSAAYEWDFLRGPFGYVGVLLGAKAVDADWVIVSPRPNVRETDTLRAPIPAVGAAARFYVGRVSVEGELSGLSIGDRGSVWEAETSARLHFSDRLAAQAGYRLLKIRGQDEGDLGDIRLSGFTFGLELSL